jgi:hypothetical protein
MYEKINKKNSKIIGKWHSNGKKRKQEANVEN